MFYFEDVFFVIEDALSIDAKFIPLILSTLFAKILIFPGPESFYLFDMVEYIFDVDVQQRFLFFLFLLSVFGLGDETLAFI